MPKCMRRFNEGGRAGKVKSLLVQKPRQVGHSYAKTLNTPRLTKKMKIQPNTHLTLVIQIKSSGGRKTPHITNKLVGQIQEKREEAWHKRP